MAAHSVKSAFIFTGTDTDQLLPVVAFDVVFVSKLPVKLAK